MKFRAARHTENLDAIIEFYRILLGLEILGKFEDHDNYDGVFLGKSGMNWHLEFTTSKDKPEHKPDDDDLHVFYLEEIEFNSIVERFKTAGINQVAPKNPYWKENGNTYLDPDGFRIVISKLEAL